MLLRSFVVVGLVGLVSLVVNLAMADDAIAPGSFYAISGVSFDDAAQPLDANAPAPFSVTLREAHNGRFSEFTPYPGRERDDNAHRRYEVAVAASGEVAGMPVDVAFAQRASIGADSEGDIARESRGAELRLGRGVNMARWETPSWDKPAWYMFLAADDEALTWRPGVRNAFGGTGAAFALQDRVEIGDMQAGITFEAGGLQASLAYVEREIEARSGSRTLTQDENFTGLTVTMRH
jgi:hypothetical protein